jgi:hypothetical protein
MGGPPLRATWDEHPNIDGPAGTLLGIHDQFPTELVDDHSALTRAISAVEDALAGGDRALAKAAVIAFDEVLVAHLDREERLVMPVLLQMTAQEGWSLLSG